MIYFWQWIDGKLLMATITFDTLEFVETLKGSGIEDQQAKAIFVAFKNAQDTQIDRLVTTQDLQLEIEKNRNDVMKEIAITKADLVRWQIGLAFGVIGILFALMKLAFTS
jgi:hypothetical protein